MGTRSATITQDGHGHELCRHYRHYDGYPEGHGVDLARTLMALDDETDPMRWLSEYLQAMDDIGCEREGPGAIHGDLEWLYLVRVPQTGRVRVTVWQIDFDQPYQDAMSGDPEADGTPRAFLAQVLGEAEPEDEDQPDEADDIGTDEPDTSVLVEFVLEGPSTASIAMGRRAAEACLAELDRRLEGRVRTQVPMELANERGDAVRVVPERVIAISMRAQDE